MSNAGVSIYGWLIDVPVEDMRGLFRTNFGNVVYGLRLEAEHLRRASGAGGMEDCPNTQRIA